MTIYNNVMGKPILIAGPCVIESSELLNTVARRLKEINQQLGTDIIFKASFDKANRTSLHSFRGPGIDKGLQMLSDIKETYGLRILTDIHEAWQAKPAGEVCDVLQIPAFLCRQTDLLVAAGRTGRTVNIKKAQFLAGRDMRYPVEKAQDAGAGEVWLTERGNMMGYGTLVVDFRNISDMSSRWPWQLKPLALRAISWRSILNLTRGSAMQLTCLSSTSWRDSSENSFEPLYNDCKRIRHTMHP